jgi:Tfp pilus assembly protein PilX
MKVCITKAKGEAAGILLMVILGIGIILGITTMGYMVLVSSQHRLVSQSMAWNTALTMAEAGIEEALAQINVSFGTNYTPSAGTNWTLSSGVYGPRSQTLSNGSYSVIIIATNRWPTIISTGYAAVPYTLKPVQRVVQVETTNMPAFLSAMIVQLDITTKGNGISVDSYDSSDPAHSTNGMYDASTRLAGGDVASLGGFVNIQNANIYGKLKTGPDGSYSVGANGSVGDLSWTTLGAIQPGWYENDFNQAFRDVDPPFTAGLPVLNVGVGTNTYILASGDYYVNGDFVINNNETLYVAGNARLYVTGNFTMKSANGSFVTIAPGATLKLYVGTQSGSPVSTAMTQVNTVGNAGTFQYWGLPSNTSMSWSGNNVYVGTVYAPEASFEAGGGGSTAFDFQGSCSVNNLSMNGHFSFHYDENLKRSGPGTGFSVTSWREL